MRATIQIKLLGVVALLLTLMLVVGLVGISRLSDVSGHARLMYHNAAAPLADMGVARAKLNEQRAFTNNHILETTRAGQAEVLEGIEKNTATIDERLKRVEGTLKLAEGRAA